MMIKATTRWRAWRNPGFPRSFPGFPRIAFRSESACTTPLLLHLRQHPGGFMYLYGPDRIRECRRVSGRKEEEMKWGEGGSPLDNRRRCVIAFALESAIYDRSRQRTVVAVRAYGIPGLINAGRNDGNNIQRPFLFSLLNVRQLAPLMEELLLFVDRWTRRAIHPAE